MAEPRDLVVLAHGMGRTSASMALLARHLRREGYHVMNWGYSRTRWSVGEFGERLLADLRGHPQASYARIHFVGHSLGTVIIRWVLASGKAPERVGRIVMLAPPNQGARSADVTAKRLGWLLKPLPELQTLPTSTARTLELPPQVEVGVIAGQYDGKVSVAETHLPGVIAHVVVPATHTFLMLRRDVWDLTVEFLRSGRFRGTRHDS